VKTGFAPFQLRPLHGIGAADRIEQGTGGVFIVGPGLLFPYLHWLPEKAGLRGCGTN
jgi:hypothetical protein